MRRILHAGLLTSAVVAGALTFAPFPVCAQMDQSGDVDAVISFDSFHDQLAPHGYWLYSDRWGIVWQPADVPYDFRPYYTAGHWVNTDDYGWYWLSDYRWGDIPFHYGRWVNDPDDGWLWIPGYIWSPGWVAWRTNGAFIGWTPMPPDDAFLEGRGDIGVGVSARFDVGALYARWYGPVFNERRFAENWVFVPVGQIAVADYKRVVIRDPIRVINIIHQTRNVTNYIVVNNVVVNRSVDVRVVERAVGHPIPVVRAAAVIRQPNLVARVDVGQRVQLRMREIAPHGRGIANSAPPPPPRVVEKLSINVAPRNGRTSVHLFTKATVAAPEVQSRFHGAPVRGPAGGGEGGGAMTGPNAERNREAQPNGMTGPGGERMRNQQPGGMTGPNGERTRERQPSGAMGPNGEQQPNGMTGPNGERARERQPSGTMGPSGEQQPNGMTGPNGERTREQQPSGATGPNGEQQPNGVNNPNRSHKPNEAAPQENANPQAGTPKGSSAPETNATPPRRQKKQPPPENPPQNPPLNPPQNPPQ